MRIFNIIMLIAATAASAFVSSCTDSPVGPRIDLAPGATDTSPLVVIQRSVRCQGDTFDLSIRVADPSSPSKTEASWHGMGDWKNFQDGRIRVPSGTKWILLTLSKGGKPIYGGGIVDVKANGRDTVLATCL